MELLESYVLGASMFNWARPGGRSMETLLIVVVVILLLGGGGWYGRGRWY